MLIPEIRSLPGVAGAEGEISNFATIIGRNGKPIRSRHAPTLGLSQPHPARSSAVSPSSPSRSPPTGPGEVAIDQATAQRQGFHVGDTVGIVTDQALQHFRISGIARLGGATFGGATFAVFSLPAAQALYLEQGRVDQIAVTATKRDVGSDAHHASDRLDSVPELVVRTAQSQANLSRPPGSPTVWDSSPTDCSPSGFIAAFLGGFAIFNTFSMTIAERIGQFAPLRALGGDRAPGAGTGVLEAGAIGVAASLVGLLAGFSRRPS